jgi:hypothetical protein
MDFIERRPRDLFFTGQGGGWVINQSLTQLNVSDPVLVRRRDSEAQFHAEVAALAPRVAVVPWSAPCSARPSLDFFATREASSAEVAP